MVCKCHCRVIGSFIRILIPVSVEHTPGDKELIPFSEEKVKRFSV